MEISTREENMILNKGYNMYVYIRITLDCERDDSLITLKILLKGTAEAKTNSPCLWKQNPLPHTIWLNVTKVLLLSTSLWDLHTLVTGGSITGSNVWKITWAKEELPDSSYTSCEESTKWKRELWSMLQDKNL